MKPDQLERIKKYNIRLFKKHYPSYMSPNMERLIRLMTERTVKGAK